MPKSNLKPLICRQCQKKFICNARATGKYPPFKNIDCDTKKECDCEDCHSANKRNKYCGNVDIIHNPSIRYSQDLEEINLSKKFSKLLTCEKCGKLFMCHARAKDKYRFESNRCDQKKICICENCHPANKGDGFCGNEDFVHNPSCRYSKI